MTESKASIGSTVQVMAQTPATIDFSQRPLRRRGISRVATWVLSVSVVALAGCASTTGTSTNQANWLDPQGSRNAKADIDALDPVTAIAAAQHPLTRQALTHLGINYRYGGKAPDQGFDCSGLIYYSAQESLGLKLPRRSADLARVGQKVDRQELAVGDLVFFNTLGRRYSHVGIYLGNELFVHAPSSGGEVRVENMTKSYWAIRYNGARRIDPILLADRLASR
jgi:cell wall-associated NlpC family hydrolase